MYTSCSPPDSAALAEINRQPTRSNLVGRLDPRPYVVQARPQKHRRAILLLTRRWGLLAASGSRTATPSGGSVSRPFIHGPASPGCSVGFDQ